MADVLEVDKQFHEKADRAAQLVQLIATSASGCDNVCITIRHLGSGLPVIVTVRNASSAVMRGITQNVGMLGYKLILSDGCLEAVFE